MKIANLTSSAGFVVMILCVVIALILFVIWFVNDWRDPHLEDMSYSFGFPTHGTYNYGGGPLRGAWPGLLKYPGWNRYYNPFMWPYYRPPYLGNYLHYY